MNLENTRGYSREKYGQVEGRVMHVPGSVTPITPPEETYRKSIELTALTAEEEALVEKAEAEATVENVARTRNAEVLAAEQQAQEDADRARAELRQRKMGEFSRSLGLAQENEAGDRGVQTQIEVGLAAERVRNEENRSKLLKGTAAVGGAGLAVGAGGLTYFGTAATTLGFSIGGVALGVGALGWASMKAWHAYKEWGHRKAFEEIKSQY
ncbi:MAG: hypothetical protein AAB794_00225 [Patescibacteria group bacterium]